MEGLVPWVWAVSAACPWSHKPWTVQTLRVFCKQLYVGQFHPAIYKTAWIALLETGNDTICNKKTMTHLRGEEKYEIVMYGDF